MPILNFSHTKPEIHRKSLRKIIFHTSRDYASVTTAHGFSYIADSERPAPERLVWGLIVVGAILFTVHQMSTLYDGWQNEPVITTLDTASMPIQEVQFPAVTICPQGAVQRILDSVLFKQLKEYMKEHIGNKTYGRVKRSTSTGKAAAVGDDGGASWELTEDEMLRMTKRFLEDVYPGAKAKPTQLVTVMTSADPDKHLQTEAVLKPRNEPECDSEHHEDLVNTFNEQLNDDGCQMADGFQVVENLGCIHSTERQMNYDEATDYCKSRGGAQLLYFRSFESLEALKKYKMAGSFEYQKKFKTIGFKDKTFRDTLTSF